MEKLKKLKISRDREKRFITKLIKTKNIQKKDISLKVLILRVFASGISARAVAQDLESVFELKY